MTDQILSTLQEASRPLKELQFADRAVIGRQGPTAAPGQEPDGQAFNKLLTEPVQPIEKPAASQLPGPMQEARKLGGILRVDEARQLSAVLDRFKQSQQSRWQEMAERMKQNPNASLAGGVSKHLEKRMQALEKQMGRMHTELRLEPAGSAAAGFEQSLGLATEELSKPIKTFFNFIARGERQLYGLQSEIDGIFSKGGELVNPAAMLKLQLKLTHVSQQLELFTSILNKGLESSKTVFNTQI